VPDDTVTLERGRPVTDTGLLCRADWARLQAVGVIAQAGLGHYSSTFSSAEAFATLYCRVLRLRPGGPRWADRDRFLLGKGHVAPGLWPILADLGFYGLTVSGVVARALELVKASGRPVKPRSVPPVKFAPCDGR
jgi:transketolase